MDYIYASLSTRLVPQFLVHARRTRVASDIHYNREMEMAVVGAQEVEDS